MLLCLAESAQHPEKILAYLSAAQLRKKRSAADGKPTVTVMVVDDEETLANTTAEILNAAGFCAFVAYDGESALDLSLKFHPDILLTDVVMPRMNGVELALAVKDNFPHTAIVLFSGQAETSDLLGKARAGGHSFDVLAKPVHPLKLIEYLKGVAGL